MTLWLPPPKRSKWMRSNKVRQITAARRNKVQTCRHRTSKLSPQPVHRWPIMDLQEILLRSFREGICAKEVKLNNTKLQEDKNCQSSGSSKKGCSRRLSLTRVLQAELYGYCFVRFIQTCTFITSKPLSWGIGCIYNSCDKSIYQ